MIIYVCAPYSTYANCDEEANRKKAAEYCKQIDIGGNIPIAPHIYLYHFIKESTSYDHALNVCFELLKKADYVYVFDDHGYVSYGMRKEIELAQSLHIPFLFVSGDDVLRGEYNYRLR